MLCPGEYTILESCPQKPYTKMVYQEMGLISSHLCFTVTAQPPLLIHLFLLHWSQLPPALQT